MESAEKKSTLCLQNLVQHIPMALGVYVGHELRIELANPAIIEIWGKGPDVIGKSYTEILPELAHQEVFDQLRRVLDTGEAFHAYDRRLDLVRNGVLSTHFFNYSFTPLRNEQGEVYAVMNTGTDVTDLNEARQQTVDAEERLRLAVESAELGMYESDLRNNTIATSPRFDVIFGLKNPASRQEIVDRIHPDDRKLRAAAHQRAAENGNLFYEARILHDDGSLHWIRAKGRVSFNPEGTPVTLIGVVQDITESKLFEENLTRQVDQRTKALNRSNEDLQQFAHVVSHDLKEPVRKIRIFNELLAEKLGDGLKPQERNYMDKIQQATDRMLLIIDGILKYSTLNASGHPISRINLNDVIAHIREDLEMVLAQKNGQILTSGLPELEGAPVLIHQLFYNLIANSLKFSKPDIPPLIEVNAEIPVQSGRGQAIITIKDNGIGIDPEYAERIFEPFQRLHARSDYEGTGLGLSLCRKVVARHHGTITATGVPGESTTITVVLPLQQEERRI